MASSKNKGRKTSETILSAPSDPYKALDLKPNASDAEVKRAYFQKVRQFPPEREPEEFQKIRRAYEQLRDPKKRAITDLFILQPPPQLPNRRRPSYDLSVHPEDIFQLAMEMVATPMQQDFQAIID